jgi:hypothetical protein
VRRDVHRGVDVGELALTVRAEQGQGLLPGGAGRHVLADHPGEHQVGRGAEEHGPGHGAADGQQPERGYQGQPAPLGPEQDAEAAQRLAAGAVPVAGRAGLRGHAAAPSPSWDRAISW